ncbi:hypothetical protein WHR41_08984 [Cladosporium halotolerans]|uniref:Uncharacterized protein n=1 Tax=Cladosporium halotolerans TaxID=1052096 RepID=A0AB34KB34_9PEZI
MASNDASSATEANSEYFDFKLYRYNPSLPAAIVAVIVFGILTALHGWLLKKARAYYFTPFLIGGIFQTVGYCGRIWSHFNQDAIGGFVMQAILILVSPALFAASIYMILGRLIRALGAEHLSLIPNKWVTKIFVTGDVIAFSLQAAGGGIQSSGTLDMYELGEKIIIAGLFVQIAIFGFFVATSVLFHTRMQKSPTSQSLRGRVPWKRHLYVLYTTSTLILIRSIFRVVEYLQGNDGYLISHEVFIYIMDALLMAAVMVIFATWYIGDLEPRRWKNNVDSSSRESADVAMVDTSDNYKRSSRASPV